MALCVQENYQPHVWPDFPSAHQPESHLSWYVSQQGNLTTKKFKYFSLLLIRKYANHKHTLLLFGCSTYFSGNKKVIFDTDSCWITALWMTHGCRPVSCDGWWCWHKEKGMFSMSLRGSCSCLQWLQWPLRNSQDDIPPNSTKITHNVNDPVAVRFILRTLSPLLLALCLMTVQLCLSTLCLPVEPLGFRPLAHVTLDMISLHDTATPKGSSKQFWKEKWHSVKRVSLQSERFEAIHSYSGALRWMLSAC